MSKRSDIINPAQAPRVAYGLVYSEILGWIDLGHAVGDDIRKLLWQMRHGNTSSSGYYEVIYSQGMYKQKRYLGVGSHIRWRIKKGTTLSECESIALAMMMRTAFSFEELQSTIPFSWVTDSGFSAEDLVSDLLGFYRVVRPMNYFPYLRIVSQEEALKRWDHYGPIGDYKNKLFKPLLFPLPAKTCVHPVYGKLPGFMTLIQPYANFLSDTVRVITNNGTHMNIGQLPQEKLL